MDSEPVKELRKTLGGNIRKARKRLGITQEQLAELLEMSPEVYGRMERGLIFPRVERLVDICGKLGVSADQLLGLALTDAAPGVSARQDEWLTVMHRFTPVLPRLTQFQRQAVRRHMTDFQRLLVTFLEPRQAHEGRRPRRGPHPT
jgi:transcriptional regulator with XRE-family HTH domain